MKIIYFVGWLFKRMFSGVIKAYYAYDNFVVDEPGIAIFPTFLVSGAIWMFALLGIVITGQVYPTGFILTLIAPGIVILNYIRIILREQYKKFIAEREKIFTILKE